MLDRKPRGLEDNDMDKRCNVLIINDFASKGGAEEVYRTSAQLLRAMPGVKVECFDSNSLSAAAQHGIARQPACSRKRLSASDPLVYSCTTTTMCYLRRSCL